MLAYVLALVIGLGSFALYMAAFFFPEVHRKEDFIWSGVGLFYALVLWVCAGRITGGVLLGQMASVALLGWFGWQTLTLRRSLTPAEQQTPVPSQNELQTQLKNISPAGGLQGVQQRVTGLFRKGQSKAQTAATSVEKNIESKLDQVAATVATPDQATPQLTSTTPEVTTEADQAEATTVEDSTSEIMEVTATPSPPAATTEVSVIPAEETAIAPETPQLLRPNPPDPELVEAAQKTATETPESSADAATPIEEIAPEVELAPPAEPPGDGDPQMRQNPPEANIPIEGVPIDPDNPPKLS